MSARMTAVWHCLPADCRTLQATPARAGLLSRWARHHTRLVGWAVVVDEPSELCRLLREAS